MVNQPPGERPEPRTFAGPKVIAALVVLTSIAAVFIFSFRTDPGAEERRKIRASAQLDMPEAIPIAIDDTGAERALKRRSELSLDERLAFRYSNPSGQKQTLTILGWDDETLHWYHPPAPEERGVPIAAGARSERLPGEITLSQRHRAGPLRIVLAFDVDPRTLAAAVQAGLIDERIVKIVDVEIR